jgi:hypothetical protein
MATWDEERAWGIINTAFEEITAGKKGSVDEFSCAKDLVELLSSVRGEAVGWTWAEACSAYSKGLNPGKYEIAKLSEKAIEDLNPERK